MSSGLEEVFLHCLITDALNGTCYRSYDFFNDLYVSLSLCTRYQFSFLSFISFCPTKTKTLIVRS